MYGLAFVITLSFIRITNAHMFAGTSARLDASQIKSNSGWNVITNWDFKSARSKPGIFMKGLTVGEARSAFLISTPGAYSIAYNLILKSTTKAAFTGGIVLDNDFATGITLKSLRERNDGREHVSAAAVLRLTVFNNITVALHINKAGNENATVEIEPGSTFSLALVTTAGAVPAFSFRLQNPVMVTGKSEKHLSGWFAGVKGAFHVSVGFLPSRDYVQAICDGIYIFYLNLNLKGVVNGAAVVKLKINQFVLREVEVNFHNTTSKNLNINQLMHLYKADIVKIAITSLNHDTEVLLESTFSMSLVNKVSQHTSGFSSRLRNNISISRTNSLVTVSGWPTDFNEVSEFKSPSLFSRLVNNNQDFSAPERGIYLITVNLALRWESVADTQLTATVYSQPSKFHLVKKTVRHTGTTNLTDVSLITTAELESVNPVSVTIQIQHGQVYLLPGSSYAIVQLPIFYPGMLERLTKAIGFSKTGWHAINNWKADEIRGGYDFLSGTNSSSGKYRVPYDGLYTASANIIVEDLGEVQAFITNSKELKFENGVFTKVGNPTSTMTLNFGGIMELKKNDEVYVMVNSPSDTDWSIKGNTGFSVAYVGQNSHAFRAYLSSVVQVVKSGWTNITTWQVPLQYGASFQPSTGQFVVPVSGVYYTTATVILGNADSEVSGAEYVSAILINSVQVTGLFAHMSGPGTAPKIRRFYPLFLSGSFKANKGDVVTLGVYSSNDISFTILEFSSWSTFLVTENDNAAQIGFSTTKNIEQNFIRTVSNEWYDLDNWVADSRTPGSFYTPSYINFDDGKSATIRITGFYSVSANIKVQGEPSPSIFKMALFIQDELQQNGISYENVRKWPSHTLHFSGTAFLREGETVKLKISSTASFNGLLIFRESGYSIVRLPIAELFPGASLISMKQHEIPLLANFQVNFWSAENTAASFTFTSGDRYNKTSGIFKVRIAGYYLASMNLFLKTEAYLGKNISVAMQYGTSQDTYMVHLNQSSVATVSSTILKYLEVGSLIYISTNTTERNPFNNSTNFLQSNVSLQEGSSFSIVHFPLGPTTTISEAFYSQDYSYSTTGLVELADWSVLGQSDKSAAIYRARSDGIHLLSMNLKLVHFIGCVTFTFNSNKGTMATTTVTCKRHCQEYITLNNFVRLWTGDRISAYVKIDPDTHFTIAKGSIRSITFIRPLQQEVGLSIRIHNATLVNATSGSWKPLHRYSLGNNTHGTFDARGNYSSFEGMIIPATGAYQVIINLILKFASSNRREGIVELVVSKDDGLSTSSGLYTKKFIETGQVSTVSMVSSVIIPKWTKLRLMIRSDIHVYIQEGSTLSLVYIDAIINEICPDEGPVMGDSLRPAYVATGIVGEKRGWNCIAYGNHASQYNWFKDSKGFLKNNNWLHLKGNLNDSGTYQCVASINGIMAESNKISVQIYDVNECYYGNHTCDANAVCANTLGSYKCSCNKGYYGNGFQCNDTNECEAGGNNCAANSVCTNKPGSFMCQCKEGYFGNGVDFCKDTDECGLILLQNICGDHSTCKNVPGSYRCICNNGWFGTDGNCTDIDECKNGTDNCDANAYCNNTNGTFTCTCKPGYSGNGVSGNCTDINECLIFSQQAKDRLSNVTETIKCHRYAACINFNGRYGCRCKAGFTGNGTFCEDVNECELGAQSLKCATATAECINMIGSYRCQCRTGYSGDGIQCLDVDECGAKTFTCDPLANCTNNYGSYDCSCPKGYIGNGKTCSAGADIGKSTDPCSADKSSLTCICKNSKTRDQNILCNGLFVAIIILSVVAVIVILFVVKYIKSRKNIKIGPAKVSRGKYIEMEDESEV